MRRRPSRSTTCPLGEEGAVGEERVEVEDEEAFVSQVLSHPPERQLELVAVEQAVGPSR
ncbi:MAG: hypothetical protein ACJ75S_03290 [Solirubrobacterales bacterium]